MDSSSNTHYMQEEPCPTCDPSPTSCALSHLKLDPKAFPNRTLFFIPMSAFAEDILRAHNTMHAYQNAVGRKLQQQEADAIVHWGGVSMVARCRLADIGSCVTILHFCILYPRKAALAGELKGIEYRLWLRHSNRIVWCGFGAGIALATWYGSQVEKQARVFGPRADFRMRDFWRDMLSRGEDQMAMLPRSEWLDV